MKTLIIGGGLSGLYLAEQLEARGQDYHLLEARDRFGGRIKTVRMSGGAFETDKGFGGPPARGASGSERSGYGHCTQ